MSLDRSIKINLHDYVWAHDGIIDEKYEVTGDVVPIVTTCDRPRSYLKHTLLGLRQEGIPDPIISMDTKQIGPVGAFLNAVKVVHDHCPKRAALIIQDDCWVTKAAWTHARTRHAHGKFVMSMFRMMPAETTAELAGRTLKHNCVQEFLSKEITDSTNRYNGGCLIFLPTGAIERIVSNPPTHSKSSKLPHRLGTYCELTGISHYQIITPLAYHFGAVSSIQGRPEGHLMPINPLMEALVEELDKKFEEDDKCQH